MPLSSQSGVEFITVFYYSSSSSWILLYGNFLEEKHCELAICWIRQPIRSQTPASPLPPSHLPPCSSMQHISKAKKAILKFLYPSNSTVCPEETASPLGASPFSSNSHARLFSFSPGFLIPGLDADVHHFSPRVILAALLKPQVLFSRCESLRLTCPLSHREIVIIQNQVLCVNSRHCRMEVYFQQWAVKPVQISNWIAKILQRWAGQCNMVPSKAVFPLLVFLFFKPVFIFLAAILFSNSITVVSLQQLFGLSSLIKILCCELWSFQPYKW